MTLGLFVYGLLIRAASPLLPFWLSRRAKAGKEDPTRRNERFAKQLPPRPDGTLVWMHGASVGECQILLALVDQLRIKGADAYFLITSQTLTSAEIVASRTSFDLRHQMAPFDTPATAERFIAHWKPQLAIFSEGEIWPNLLKAADNRGSALALVNARMTDTSISNWNRVSQSASSVFSRFDLMIAANTTTADALSALSAKKVVAPGNLKTALPPPIADADARDAIQSRFIGHRKCILAASTHDGEEDLFLRALADVPGEVCAIIAPRHPERGDTIAEALEHNEVSFSRRSLEELPKLTDKVLLADTLGEMGLWYDIADAVYLGGASLPNIGGHNPIEPLHFAKPIISGPHHFNFKDLFEVLSSIGGLTLASDASDLSQLLSKMLTSPSDFVPTETDRLAFLSRSNSAMSQTVAELLSLLETPERP